MTMLKKAILLTAMFCYMPYVAIAETCPSPAKIKAHQFMGWKVYDSQENRLLNPRLLTRFIKNADQFSLAELSKNGIIHCYYRNKKGSNLEAYVAKDTFQKIPPKKIHAYWYPVSGFLHCAAGKNQCEFTEKNANAQLAQM